MLIAATGFSATGAAGLSKGAIEERSLSKVTGANAGVVTNVLDNSLARIAQDGHALVRHGGFVTNEQLIARATTGVAPDGSYVIRNGQKVIP